MSEATPIQTNTQTTPDAGAAPAAPATPEAAPATTADNAAPPAPATQAEVFTVFNAQGQPIGNLNADNAQIQAMNASAAAQGIQSERLTSFAVGYPDDELATFMDFILPAVRTPMAFNYRTANELMAFAIEDDDAYGPNGLPRVVKLERGDSNAIIHQSRGLETFITQDEMDLAANDPSWSREDEENDRTVYLLNMLRRGRIARAIVLAAASAGSAEAVSWGGSTGDPQDDLRAIVDEVALAYGGRQNVRVAFGATAMSLLWGSALIRGGANYPAQDQTIERLARLIELPPANIRTLYNQYAATVQGRTTNAASVSKSYFLSNDIYVFGVSQTPTRNDSSWGKRFWNPLNGQEMEVYTYNPHPHTEYIGCRYRNEYVATNTAAIKRITVSDENAE